MAAWRRRRRMSEARHLHGLHLSVFTFATGHHWITGWYVKNLGGQVNLYMHYRTSNKMDPGFDGMAGDGFDLSIMQDQIPKGSLNMAYITTDVSLGHPELEGFMNHSRAQVCAMSFVRLLQRCIRTRAFADGKKIHAYYINSAIKPNSFVENTLMNMYISFGTIEDACKVLETMHRRTVFSWTIIIAGCARHGDGKVALKYFQEMEQEDLKPDNVTYVSVLSGCCSIGAVEDGKRIHACLLKTIGDADTFIANALVDMYGKCGNVDWALQVFNNIPKRDIVSWNSIFSVPSGLNNLNLFYQMQEENLKPNRVTFISMLTAPIDALKEGKLVHAHTLLANYASDIFIGSILVGMYGKNGSINDAFEVFDRMSGRNIVSWNALVAGSDRLGDGKVAIRLFEEMQKEGIRPNKTTYINVVHAIACDNGAAEQGKQIHACILLDGWASDILVASTMVDMYAKCGRIKDARQLFDWTSRKDLILWNTIIGAYAQGEHGNEAMNLYMKMQDDGMEADRATFSSVLGACIHDIAILESIHYDILKTGYETDVFVGSTLIDAYFRCGVIKNACQVFETMPIKTVVSWNVMISGFAQHGRNEVALQIFKQMQQEGVKPNEVIYASVISTCADIPTLGMGKIVHAGIILGGHESSTVVCNTLIDMYAKSGSINDAFLVFRTMTKQSVVSWSSIISGCGLLAEGRLAVQVFKQMQHESVRQNEVSYISVLNACGSIEALNQGKRIHAEILQMDHEPDIFVSNTLIDMYSKCGSITNASQIFNLISVRDLVSWNVMVMGYSFYKNSEEAFRLLCEMQKEGMHPNAVTFVNVLSSYNDISSIGQGREVHVCIKNYGLELDVFVATALVDMYIRFGVMEDARHVFDNMPKWDIVSWNTMIGGYAQQGAGKNALDLFKEMRQMDVEPNEVTYVHVLSACAAVAALEQGKQFHADIAEAGYDTDVFVGSTLVDMYAKCGCTKDAHTVFNKMHSRNVVSWNALIAGFAQSANGKETLRLFSLMQKEGMEPNDLTACSIISACSHASFIDEGCHYFNMISSEHGILPEMYQYTCMVDLLGRAGFLDTAEDFVIAMPCQPNIVVWTSLVSACRTHGNVTMAERTTQHILKLEPWNASAFVLLSNAYATIERHG